MSVRGGGKAFSVKMAPPQKNPRGCPPVAEDEILLPPETRPKFVEPVSLVTDNVENRGAAISSAGKN